MLANIVRVMLEEESGNLLLCSSLCACPWMLHMLQHKLRGRLLQLNAMKASCPKLVQPSFDGRKRSIAVRTLGLVLCRRMQTPVASKRSLQRQRRSWRGQSSSCSGMAPTPATCCIVATFLPAPPTHKSVRGLK